jgi:hypothetical protein
MAKPTVDGQGQAKLEVLEAAAAIAQTLHGMIEKHAIAVRANSPTTSFAQTLKRTATPLVGMLRGQFKLLSDLATDLILISGRGGGSEVSKLRMLREKIGLLKSGIELSVTSTLSKHTIKDDKPATAPAPTSTGAGGE